MYYREHINSKIVEDISAQYDVSEDTVRDVIEHQYSFLKEKIVNLDLKHVKFGGTFVFKPRYERLIHIQNGFYIRYPYSPRKQEEHVRVKLPAVLSGRTRDLSFRLENEYNMRVFKYNKGLIKHGCF